jgi:hypothetical protein
MSSYHLFRSDSIHLSLLFLNVLLNRLKHSTEGTNRLRRRSVSHDKRNRRPVIYSKAKMYLVCVGINRRICDPNYSMCWHYIHS